MTKLEKAMRRQSVLTAKLMDETITDEEKAELNKLTKAIQAATAPKEQTQKTTLKTIKLSEFKESVDKLMAGDPTPEELALAKKNLAAVKDQGATEEDAIVAIEVPFEVPIDKTVDGLAARVEALEAELKAAKKKGFDARTQTGVTGSGAPEGDGETPPEGDGETPPEGDGETPPEGDGDTSKNENMPHSTMAALESITAIVERYQKIKDMIAAGTEFSSDDLSKMWPSWELRDAVENATAVLAKLEAFKELMEAVQPTLDKMHKDETAKPPEGDGKTPPAGDGETPPEGDDETPPEGEGTTKSNSEWLGGGDMSPVSEGGNKDFEKLRKKRVI